jgi:hypothetical protein
MSHRIAELMDLAEHARTKSAREAAAQQCESVILRLWDRRTSWPKGWPPPTAAAALDRLSSAEDQPDEFGFYRQGVVDKGERTWLGTLPLIADLHRTELDIWRDAALVDLDVREIAEWLKQHKENLSDEDQDVLEQLVEGHERARRRLERQQSLVQSPTNTGQDPGEANSVSVFVERLDELARRRAELLDRLRPVKGKEVTTRRRIERDDG